MTTSYLYATNSYQDINELKKLLKENGYLFIKSFFPTHEVSTLRKIVANELLKQGWCREENNQMIPVEPANRIGSPPFIDYIKSIMQAERIHEFCEANRLKSLMSELLEREVFSHPRKMIRVTYPYDMNPDDLVLPHQDLFYVKGEKDTLVAWIALGNYPPSHGGLQVAHGSHKDGLYPVKANKEGRFNCAASDLEMHAIDWRSAEYELGDLLIMHSLTMHASGQNFSQEFRLSLDCRFSRADGYINEEQLLPPYYPKVPTWGEFNTSWLKEHFTLPPSLKIESVNTPLNEILSRPSMYTELE